MTGPEGIEALVFDLDGLFADTQKVWKKAQQRLFAERGRSYGPEEERALLGISREAAGTALAAFLGGREDEAPAFYKQLHELVRREIEAGVEPMPGAVDLVQAAKNSGLGIGLASNGPGDLVAQTLISIGATKLFDAIVTADDVAWPKPAPDVYTEACRRLAVTPACAVALEDSPTGIEAALAAGLRTIVIPSAGAERIAGAALVADSLSDPRLWALVGLVVNH